MPTPTSEIVITLVASMESFGIAVVGLIGLGLTVVGIGFGLVATGLGFWTRFLCLAGTVARLCLVVFAFTFDDGAGAVVGVYVGAGGVYVGAGGGLGFTGAGSGFGVAALAAGAGTLAISPSTRAVSASWSRRAAVPSLTARARPVSGGTRLIMTTRRPGAIRWMRGKDAERSCRSRYGRDRGHSVAPSSATRWGSASFGVGFQALDMPSRWGGSIMTPKRSVSSSSCEGLEPDRYCSVRHAEHRAIARAQAIDQTPVGAGGVAARCVRREDLRAALATGIEDGGIAIESGLVNLETGGGDVEPEAVR
jgi:hypothetical protein